MVFTVLLMPLIAACAQLTSLSTTEGMQFVLQSTSFQNCTSRFGGT